jgi:hypothetical protein
MAGGSIPRIQASARTHTHARGHADRPDRQVTTSPARPAELAGVAWVVDLTGSDWTGCRGGVGLSSLRQRECRGVWRPGSAGALPLLRSLLLVLRDHCSDLPA